MRPAKLTTSSPAELSRLLRTPSGEIPSTSNQNAVVGSVLEAVKHNDLTAIRNNLGIQLMRLGLQRFLAEFLAPLNAAVGDGWSRGEVSVSQEHLYSEQVQSLLRQAIESAPQGAHRPRILLTTLPGEEHHIGLLMAQAWLITEGAQCISLGVKTPVGEVIRSAAALEVDIVGLSFSEAVKFAEAVESLTVLRAALEPNVAIWAGGRLWEDCEHRLPGIEMIPTLGEVSTALTRWRGLH
jgi:methanogenic corrinoid protein MtbC1